MKAMKMQKLCECGCGQLAPLATKTDSSTNRIKGQPMRFVKGHNNYGRKRPDLEAQLQKLRELHTWQFEYGKYWEMQRTGEKIKDLLDSIVRHFPNWKEKDK